MLPILTLLRVFTRGSLGDDVSTYQSNFSSLEKWFPLLCFFTHLTISATFRSKTQARSFGFTVYLSKTFDFCCYNTIHEIIIFQVLSFHIKYFNHFLNNVPSCNLCLPTFTLYSELWFKTEIQSWWFYFNLLSPHASLE